MKHLFIKITLAGLLLMTLDACKKKDDLSKPILGLGGDTWEKGPVDVWIAENLTKPYNIEVKYRWDATELALNRTLVPPDINQVVPVMDAVKKAWIQTYLDIAGEVFVKKLIPKQFVLVGSYKFNSNGSVDLGSAEGGRKVTLFNLNEFDHTYPPSVLEMMRTIHHEFGHILHQTIMYPLEFKKVTPAGYTAAWYNVTIAQAREEGFITDYAKNSPDDDFVEMISVMLTEGSAGYNDIINNIDSDAGKAALRKKEQLVVSYFRNAYKIDFYKLQDRSEHYILEVINN
jgi:substrate import-associated zinc metallohydrolase lipoprotein